MDILYTGDIPKEYHYARFGSNYIDLYDRQNLTNGTYTYYRVYLYDNTFLYDIGQQTYSSYNTYYARNIEVTDNYMHRRDLPDILTCVFFFTFFFVILFNVFTSIIKKGGLLSGLF